MAFLCAARFLSDGFEKNVYGILYMQYNQELCVY